MLQNWDESRRLDVQWWPLHIVYCLISVIQHFSTFGFSANAAFILLLTSEKNKNNYNARKWRDLGVLQVQILMGYYGQSYVVGYGLKSPQQPYHRASSCPSLKESCGFSYLSLDAPNPRVSRSWKCPVVIGVSMAPFLFSCA